MFSRDGFVGPVLQKLLYSLLPFRREASHGGFVAEVGEFPETLLGGNGGENAAAFCQARPGIGGSMQK
jgi:hypothetical protein